MPPADLRPRFDTASLIAATNGRAIGRGGPGPITADSSAMARGQWFVALAGEGFDDHVNVPEAARREVAGVVVQRAFPDLAVPQVVVADTWQALRQLAAAARDRFTGPVVAITGSYGKTTTRALTRCALAPLGEVHHTRANHNGDPGVPLTLLDCPTTAAAQVLEIGTFQPGEIARQAAIFRPTVRVVTCVDAAHLDRLGDLEGVAREKGALLDAAQPGDRVVVDGADRWMAAWPLPAGVERHAVGPGGTVQLRSAEPRGDRLHARFTTPQGPVEATLATEAPFVAANARFALATAAALGLDLRDAAAAMEAFTPEGRRLRPVQVAGATVYDDTFNASPASMVAAIRWLARRPGPRVAVLGDMGALGAHSASHHAAVVQAVIDAGLADVLLIGPQLAQAAAALPRDDRQGFDTDLDLDLDRAVRWLHQRLCPGATALVKGGRDMALDRVVDALAAPGDDDLRR